MKKLSLLLALILCLSAFGCDKTADRASEADTEGSTENTTESIVEEPKENIDGVVTRFLVEESERNIISAQYPVFSGEGNEDINLLIRNFIFNEVNEWCEGSVELVEADSGSFEFTTDYTLYYADIEYDITYDTDDMISIIFSGMFYMKDAAHPNHIFWTLNIDPRTGAQISFTDKYTASEQLYDVFAEYAKKHFVGTTLEDADFEGEICSRESFLDGIKEEERFYFYYTGEGVGISYPVPFAVGDHLEVVIPYDVMESFKNDGDEPATEIGADEALRLLLDAVAERGVDYPLFCQTNRPRTIDGIECYEIQLCTESSQDLYDENGEAYKLSFTYGWFAVDRYTGKVYEQTVDMEHLAEFSKEPTEPPFDPTTAEDYDYICEMAESDVRFKWVKAFVEKDVTTCADMMQIFDKKYWSERNYKYYEWFEYLNLLEFGGYSVELTEKDEHGNDTLYFTFEIARSDYDVFPAGTYKYEVYEGMMSHTGWSRVDKEEPKPDEWLYSNVKYFVQMLTLDKNSDNWKRATDGIFLTLFMHNRENGRLEGDFISEEILQAEAMAAFGVEDFVPGDGFAHTTEGGYYIRGRGGPMAQYEISKVEVNGDVTDIYVQFFADPMDTVKSYYVKYSFEKTGGDYPYRMLSIDILDEGVYPPFFWSV